MYDGLRQPYTIKGRLWEIKILLPWRDVVGIWCGQGGRSCGGMKVVLTGRLEPGVAERPRINITIGVIGDAMCFLIIGFVLEYHE